MALSWTFQTIASAMRCPTRHGLTPYGCHLVRRFPLRALAPR
jgi:hypothetical protein